MGWGGVEETTVPMVPANILAEWQKKTDADQAAPLNAITFGSSLPHTSVPQFRVIKVC